MRWFLWSRPRVSERTLVVDTPMEVSAWLNGRPVAFPRMRRDQGEPRTALVELPKGSSRLLMRLTRNGGANRQALVATTFVADQPVGFDSGASGSGSGAGGQP